MPTIKLRITADIENAILTAIQDVGSISGVGADGDSEYSITDVTVASLDSDGGWYVTVDLERESGKFASSDDLADALVDELDTIELPIEVDR